MVMGEAYQVLGRGKSVSDACVSIDTGVPVFCLTYYYTFPGGVRVSNDLFMSVSVERDVEFGQVYFKPATVVSVWKDGDGNEVESGLGDPRVYPWGSASLRAWDGGDIDPEDVANIVASAIGYDNEKAQEVFADIR